MTNLSWPDVVIAVIVLLGALKGFKSGLVRELTGAVALFVGIAAALHYPGMWDGFIAAHVKAAAGAAHIIGTIAYAVLAYAVVLALGSALSAIAKLPLIGIANALGGAVVGAAKAVVLVWVVLYVALFFPLAHGVREDLHRSALVTAIERPNERFDAALRATLPPSLTPFVTSLLDAHRF